MRMSDQIDHIAEALSAAQGQIEAASKAVSNTFFKSKYADLNALREVIREPLAANGLSVVQGARYMPDTGSVCVETMLLHLSGQYIAETLDLPVTVKYDRDGVALPIDVQGIGSAISYGRRYSLSALLSLAAEDDDGNAAANAGGQNAPKTAQKKMAVSAKLLEEGLSVASAGGSSAVASWWTNLSTDEREALSTEQRKAIKAAGALYDSGDTASASTPE